MSSGGLILISGAFAGRLALRPLAQGLTPYFSAVAYDRRGRGASGDTAPYAIGREIEDLAAVVSATAGPACVFGHSSGAGLALRAAADGLPVGRLARHEPPYIIDDSRPPIPAGFGARLAGLVASGRRSEALEYWMEQTVRTERRARPGSTTRRGRWPTCSRTPGGRHFPVPTTASPLRPSSRCCERSARRPDLNPARRYGRVKIS